MGRRSIATNIFYDAGREGLGTKVGENGLEVLEKKSALTI